MIHVAYSSAMRTVSLPPLKSHADNHHSFFPGSTVARSALTRLLSALPVAVVAAASAAAVTVAAMEATVAARVATAVARAATVVVRVATVNRVARAVTAAVTRCSCHEAYEGLDVISTFLRRL